MPPDCASNMSRRAWSAAPMPAISRVMAMPPNSPATISRPCARGARRPSAKGLSPDRPEDERAAIIDRFYDAYETQVRELPEGHGMDYVHCYLVIRKA
jgi:hypothetical protein